MLSLHIAFILRKTHFIHRWHSCIIKISWNSLNVKKIHVALEHLVQNKYTDILRITHRSLKSILVSSFHCYNSHFMPHLIDIKSLNVSPDILHLSGLTYPNACNLVFGFQKFVNGRICMLHRNSYQLLVLKKYPF